ncbi:MAG: ABC transporter ATP-binding protein/permease [Clostridiales bacterium]|nr:ABC transporter ATP-binding protein/permease [Clostridiales bacterium]
MKHTLFQENIRTINSSFQGLEYVWSREANGKLYIILRCISSVLNSLLPLVFVMFPGLLIDELTGEQSMSRIAFYAAAIVGSPLLLFAVNKPIEYLTTTVLSKFNNNSNRLMYGKIAEIDLEELEKPDVDQLKFRALNAIEALPSVVDNYCGVLGAIIQFCLVITLVFTLNAWMVLIVIAVAIINFFASKWLVKKGRESELESDILNRIRDTFIYILQETEFAKEIRMFKSKDYLIDHMMENEEETNRHDLKYKRKTIAVSGISVVGKFVQQVFLYCYLIVQVLRGVLSVGTMTICISSVEQLSSSLNKLSGSVLSLASMKYSLNDISDFFSIPQRQISSGTEHPDLSGEFTIKFKDVSFKYPGSDRYALRHLNIVIRSDERICIVGENGSGKSTFIKLLTRMYYPTEGEILLNGKNIYSFDYYEYIGLFAPVFQDFCRYSFEVEDNICLSDDIDSEKLHSAIDDVGLTDLIASLPKQEHTKIGKFIDPDGFEPSGGEGQRIAIARAIYHGGDIYLLDEPTAALDPRAEYEIYAQFHKMIHGKCAVLITHRLSAVQLANKVAVFDDGHVAEYGTHSELYAKGGIYRDMFDKQAEFYRET